MRQTLPVFILDIVNTQYPLGENLPDKYLYYINVYTFALIIDPEDEMVSGCLNLLLGNTLLQNLIA